MPKSSATSIGVKAAIPSSPSSPHLRPLTASKAAARVLASLSSYAAAPPPPAESLTPKRADTSQGPQAQPAHTPKSSRDPQLSRHLAPCTHVR
eukprot:CAMPEP_0119322464 /NCGR_PEP_ID=MMETSP1333-20130426/58287_1 /TAXON_ID=418940 /ORGANISM="Scyphosphaera apsteinii, Strain RCC1455" /LENGTH=92 /DNA_ID=CAMNT_0007329707 /DNA_START=392 /DNA_END=671 /DNA_ORIENTATION=+